MSRERKASRVLWVILCVCAGTWAWRTGQYAGWLIGGAVAVLYSLAWPVRDAEQQRKAGGDA